MVGLDLRDSHLADTAICSATGRLAAAVASPSPLFSPKRACVYTTSTAHVCVKNVAPAGAPTSTDGFASPPRREGSAEEKNILPLHVFSDPDNSSAHIEFLHLGYVCLNTVATTGLLALPTLILSSLINC
ncbi:Os02g0601901 [Oryza sativa Japonica Group]|uniref:Os02g0601901 protein n=1 Tax=Oryza sativa subsp. japonica TaxID=39947 RepID=A0A0P0VLC5_ORYSJ|nr:Os02g0601901 [Oryza sativa Japonica Group]